METLIAEITVLIVEIFHRRNFAKTEIIAKRVKVTMPLYAITNTEEIVVDKNFYQ